MCRNSFKFTAVLTVLLLCPLLIGWPSAVTAAGKASARKKVFRAGAATANITPPVGAIPSGEYNPTPSTHIHDELHVRCLVLDNGQTRLCIAICDSLGIPRDVLDEAKRRLKQKADLPVDHVLTAATHTHSGPSAYGSGTILPGEERFC